MRGIYGPIVTALSGTPKFHHAAVSPKAHELLATESSECGKQVVLVIDEAHLLAGEGREGVRCLSNVGWTRPAPLPTAARPAHVAPPIQPRRVTALDQSITRCPGRCSAGEPITT